MYFKLTTALLIGLVHSAALNLSPRQEEEGTLMCTGSCDAENPDTICLWSCPSGTVCGQGKDDCPIQLPEPIELPTIATPGLPSPTA